MKTTFRFLFAVCTIVAFFSTSCQPTDYSADISALKASRDSLAAALKLTNTNLLSTNTILASLTNSVSSIQAQLVIISGQISALNSQLAATNAIVAGHTATIAAIQAQIKTIQDQIAVLNAQQTSTSAALSTLSADVTSIKTQLSSILTQVATLNSQQTVTSVALSDLYTKLALSNSQLNSLTLQLNALLKMIPSNGLVAWYPFNGNANDESGNGNNGTANGVSLIADRFSIPNKAYNFNGINNTIVVPNSNSLNFSTNQLSMSFWLKMPSYPAAETHIISKYSGVGTTTSGFMVVAYSSISTFVYRYQNTIVAGWGFVEIPMVNLPTNTWFHVVTTTDQGYDKLYINGILKTSNLIKYNGAIGSNTESLRFGIGPPLNPRPYFNGSMDDIRFYNRALTPVEVTALYNE